MDLVKKFISLLNSPILECNVAEFYDEHSDFICESWSEDFDKFFKYFKAYYLDSFFHSTLDIQGMLIGELEDECINIDIIEKFIDIINGAHAQVSDPIDGIVFEQDEDLTEHENCDEYSYAKKRRVKIAEEILVRNNIIEFRDLKNGDYRLEGEYQLDESEIKAIENARLFQMVVQSAHLRYDEFCEDDDRTICNYDAIKDERVRKLVPHTNKDNPNVDILFKDGTVINYYKGDIRIYPENFGVLVDRVMLALVSLYKDGNDNPAITYLLENIENLDLDVPLEDMKPKQFRKLLGVAIDLETAAFKSSIQIYSQKMIADSRRKIYKLSELAKEYKL